MRAAPPPPPAPDTVLPDVGPAPSKPPERARAIGRSATVLAGLGGVLLAGRAVGLHAPACPFRTITGVPCPGCGMTRLADAVAHGRLHLALGADPAGVLLLSAIAVLAVVHLTTVVVGHREPPRWLQGWLIPSLLIGLLALHWGTTIVTGTLPST